MADVSPSLDRTNASYTFPTPTDDDEVQMLNKRFVSADPVQTEDVGRPYEHDDAIVVAAPLDPLALLEPVLDPLLDPSLDKGTYLQEPGERTPLLPVRLPKLQGRTTESARRPEIMLAVNRVLRRTRRHLKLDKAIDARIDLLQEVSPEWQQLAHLTLSQLAKASLHDYPALYNSIGVLRDRVKRTRPLAPTQVDNALLAVLEKSEGVRLPRLRLATKIATDNLDDPERALSVIWATARTLVTSPRARKRLDPHVLATLDSLHDEAETALDGIALQRALAEKADQPSVPHSDPALQTVDLEHDVIRDAGADDTVLDVVKADRLLTAVGEADKTRDSYEKNKQAAQGHVSKAYPPLTALLRKDESNDASGTPRWECETKVELDPTKLPRPLPQPWIIVQGYLSDDPQGNERSVRIIPARHRAFLRTKSKSLSGCRTKTSVRIDYDDAIAHLGHASGVVYKFRRIVRDQTGRAWLVDHLPLDHHWHAETELPRTNGKLPDVPLPDWATNDVTHTERGYTRSYARPVPQATLDRLLAYAQEHGSTKRYAFKKVEGPDAHAPQQPAAALDQTVTRGYADISV